MDRPYLLSLFVAVLVAASLFAFWRLSGRGGARLRYQQIRPLSPPEQALYWRLVEALPECVILSQVTFSRFMKPDTGGLAPRREYQALRNRVSQKTADFLVCLKDFTVVAAIELDDSSHVESLDRQRDELLRAAGIAVLRVPSRDMPSVARLRELFTQ
ncbi:MAG TPA: DUF2726 domain-containing protein [Usitatibacter sp.]|nr:DUF2726 domain-containing protein [Usitatibacter sp.]